MIRTVPIPTRVNRIGDVCATLYPGQGLVTGPSGNNCVTPQGIADAENAQLFANYFSQAGTSINPAVLNPTLTTAQRLELVGIAPAVAGSPVAVTNVLLPNVSVQAPPSTTSSAANATGLYQSALASFSGNSWLWLAGAGAAFLLLRGGK